MSTTTITTTISKVQRKPSKKQWKSLRFDRGPVPSHLNHSLLKKKSSRRDFLSVLWISCSCVGVVQQIKNKPLFFVQLNRTLARELFFTSDAKAKQSLIHHVNESDEKKKRSWSAAIQMPIDRISSLIAIGSNE